MIGHSTAVSDAVERRLFDRGLFKAGLVHLVRARAPASTARLRGCGAGAVDSAGWFRHRIEGAAIYYRKKPAQHKMLMLLTAINFLPPAIARIPIDSLRAFGPLWFFGLPTVLALFCVGVDVQRNRRVNGVFLAGALLLIASYAVRLVLMPTNGWMAAGRWLTSFV